MPSVQDYGKVQAELSELAASLPSTDQCGFTVKEKRRDGKKGGSNGREGGWGERERDVNDASTISSIKG